MRALRTFAASAGLLAALLTAATAFAQFKPPPAPTQWVTDRAGFLSPQAEQQLNARLRAFEQATGSQVVVWIDKTLGREALEDFAVRTFDAWNIGRAGKDDGVALFVFAEDRKLRIEVGYGLEGVLPDAIANRIIQERTVPLLRAGQPDAAINAAVSGILEAIGGETSPPQGTVRPYGQRPAPAPPSLGQLIVYGIVGILLLILFITNPRLALYLLISVMSGGRGGGGGGGGGGFRGGGGRSGGGGASGSW